MTIASCPASTPRLNPTSASNSALTRQAEISQHAREAESVYESKRKCHHPPTALKKRENVVERCKHNRQRNRRFGQTRGQRDDAERRKTQSDGMRDGEGGDDLKHVQSAVLKRATGSQRLPVSTSTAGSSSDNKNRMWSKPIHMCHTPSRP